MPARISLPPIVKTAAIPLAMVVLGVFAFGSINGLQQRADSARASQNRVEHIKLVIERLNTQPHLVLPEQGLTIASAEKGVAEYRALLDQDFAALEAAPNPPTELGAVTDATIVSNRIVDEILSITRETGTGVDIKAPIAGKQLAHSRVVDEAIAALGAEYIERAQVARRQAKAGTIATVVLLLLAFMIFYFRSVGERSMVTRLLSQNEMLLAASREEALTDALTGLPNRRSLSLDLARQIPSATTDSGLALALFDLDGFKRYNDTFGHGAGDELLARLGGHLRIAATRNGATAYRLGGDEFCLLCESGPDGPAALVEAASDALADEGDGWTIGASVGTVLLPLEASDAQTALVLADQRMYADKALRKGRPSTLQSHGEGLKRRVQEMPTGPVSAMATAVGEHLQLAGEDIEALRVAADLHDIGKSAIPDSILAKRGQLNDEEWAFVRQHTITGGRLAYAAHARETTAALVRSSHEHFDGTGYPDGMAGAAIPLGARIIAVCDAYNAMTSERPFRTAMKTADAIGELRACAGSQFDPAVVEAFLASNASAAAQAQAAATPTGSAT